MSSSTPEAGDLRKVHICTEDWAEQFLSPPLSAAGEERVERHNEVADHLGFLLKNLVPLEPGVTLME